MILLDEVVQRFEKATISPVTTVRQRTKTNPPDIAVRGINGGIRWKSAWVHVSLTCAGEYLGLEAVDNQIWNVYFGPLRLGRLSEKHMRIEDQYGSLWRHNKKLKL